MNRNLTFISIFTFILITASMGHAQQADLDELFQWDISLDQPEVSKRDSGEIKVQLIVEDDHIVYKERTKVSVADVEGIQFGEPTFPKPIIKTDPLDGLEKEVYAHTVEFIIPYTIQENVSPGEKKIQVQVGYQGCSKTICYFPQKRELSTSITIKESSTASRGNELDDLFQWSITDTTINANPGAFSSVSITLKVAPNHIVYRERTTIKPESVDGIDFSEPLFPKPKLKVDPIDGQEKEVYEGTVEFKLPFTPKPDSSGKKDISVTVGYQGCSQTLCYFPQKRELVFSVNIQGDKPPFVTSLSKETEGYSNTIETRGAVPEISASAKASKSAGQTQAQNKLDDLFSGGFLLAYFGIYLAGLATSFTPCVYPLIPITITIFGAREAKSKWQGFTLAATYVLGIAVMYSALGFAAARTGAVFGQYMSNPLVIGFVAAIFVAMGASMLGAFDLQVPTSLQAKLTQVGGKGYGSAFFMGLIAGIIAAPCTGPVLLSILTIVAQSANPVLGISLLVTYAVGLGTLFLFIGTFSGFISKLPKSGGWMEHVKSIFGIILFAFALYYLKDVIPGLKSVLDYSAATYTIVSIMMLLGLMLGAVHLSFHTNDFLVRTRKSLGVLLCTIALYVGMGSVLAVQADIAWHHDLEKAITIAKAENKPIMIDFYADWCAICKEIEAYTLAAPEVSQALKDYVNVKLDLTAETEENDAIESKFGIRGLPWMIFLDSQGKQLPIDPITGFINKEDFLKVLEKVESIR